MTKEDALKARDKYRLKLVGKDFDNSPKWKIIDVIIADKISIRDIYTKMWDMNISNEAALLFFNIKPDNYIIYIISHQWSWGSGDLLFENIESYLKHNSI